MVEFIRESLTFDLVPINGETGILLCLDDKPVVTMSFVTDGARISAGFSVLNPDKLARVSPDLLRRRRRAIATISSGPVLRGVVAPAGRPTAS